MDIDSLSLEELQKLRQAIDERIRILELEKDIQGILHAVDVDGYYLTTERSQDDIPLMSMELRYNVDVSTFDRDHECDISIYGASDKQPGWVDALKFKYTPRDGDQWLDTDDWEYGDRDDPVIGHTSMPVYLYYKCHQESPPKFRSINHDGEVETWEIKGNDVYIEDKLIGTIDEIAVDEAFIIPEVKP